MTLHSRSFLLFHHPHPHLLPKDPDRPLQRRLGGFAPALALVQQRHRQLHDLATGLRCARQRLEVRQEEDGFAALVDACLQGPTPLYETVMQRGQHQEFVLDMFWISSARIIWRWVPDLLWLAFISKHVRDFRESWIALAILWVSMDVNCLGNRKCRPQPRWAGDAGCFSTDVQHSWRPLHWRLDRSAWRCRHPVPRSKRIYQGLFCRSWWRSCLVGLIMFQPGPKVGLVSWVDHFIFEKKVHAFATTTFQFQHYSWFLPRINISPSTD